MHITLHLTSGCNLRCSYCYSPPKKRMDMSEEVVGKAIEFVRKISPHNTGIIFFGGEPLLRKDLIKKAMKICRESEKKHGGSFHFKVTTNGLLLDDDFLQFATNERLQIALSIDGSAAVHDRHRQTIRKAGTHARIEKKLGMLLRSQPYAYALMVITPETVGDYARSMEYLIEKGFHYIIASLNYAGKWNDGHLRELKKQYQKLAKLYERWTREQKKFYFSPFEKKFASHIQGKDALCQQCHFGIKQVSIAPDGTIYPCVQFVQDGVSNRDFGIGDVFSGIDPKKQETLYQLSRKSEPLCDDCALNERCEHRCSCLNWQSTGSINSVSPLLCETERILIPIVDRLGEKLYSQGASVFIQKHYNAAYPYISCLEDIIH